MLSARFEFAHHLKTAQLFSVSQESGDRSSDRHLRAQKRHSL